MEEKRQTRSAVDVVFVITGDIRFNSRALKQLKLLSDEGYSVLAVGLGDEPLEYQLDEHVLIKLLRRPEGHGPAFFWRCHKLFNTLVSNEPASVYHASDLYNLPAVARAANKHQAKLVYDARERYPYVAAAVKRPWVRLFWEGIESHFIKKADAVFTVSQRIASHMAVSYNIELPEVLYNVPAFREREPSNLLREALCLPADKKIVLHQGKMQKDRGCLLLARAMRHVEGAVLVFLGDGPLKPAVRAAVTSLELEDRVKFKDAVPPAALHGYTCSADIGVTLLEDTCLNHRFALPNKLFEYLMAGLPVLASDLPEMGRIVDEYGVGRVVYPDKPEEIARVLQQMIDDPAQCKSWSAGAERVLETFNWEIASQIFRRIYKNLVHNP